MRSRDMATLAATFLCCVAGGALHPDDTVGAPLAWTYPIALAATAALAARRRRPFGTLAVTTACALAVAPAGLLATPLVIAPVAVAAFCVARRRSDRDGVLAVAAAAVVVVACSWLFEDDLSWADVSRMVSLAATPVVAAVLGHASHQRRAYLESVEERARLAEEGRAREIEHRTGQERLRIARDLHDVVAHQITLANAQASVAAQLFDVDPEAARTNLGDVVHTTRHALDELRATVGLLRQGGPDAQSTEPTPGLDRLDELFRALDGAGLAVSFHQDGTPSTLPATVDVTAYRIVQEALTNAAKHASTPAADVHVRWEPDLVAVTVANDRRPDAAGDTSVGYGLVGMRERAAAVGGSLDTTSPDPDRFVVRAHLPIRGSEDADPTEQR